MISQLDQIGNLDQNSDQTEQSAPSSAIHINITYLILAWNWGLPTDNRLATESDSIKSASINFYFREP